jgi:ABC-type uncharacterized transport system ATPase subunit
MTPSADSLLSLDALGKRFGSLQALEGVSLDVQAGTVQCLLGENGAGKSTLCNLIFGVYEPSAGHMTFGGTPWAPASPADALEQGIAMVHQHFSLVPRMTVVENLMLGQAKGMLRRREFGNRIRDIAERFGFALDPDAVVGELSVGERQRAEIVKCLMRDPKLLVLDEPTAVLPPGEIGALLDICRRVADSGRAVILVTHKLAEIAKVADRVAVLRTGRLVADESMTSADMGALVHAMVGREVKPLDVALAEPDEAPAADVSNAPRGFALVCDGLTVQDRHGAVRVDNFTSRSGPARSSAWPASRATARASSAWCWPACCGRPKAASISATKISPTPAPRR